MPRSSHRLAPTYRRFRPTLEALETREVPSTIPYFMGDFNGDQKQDFAQFRNGGFPFAPLLESRGLWLDNYSDGSAHFEQGPPFRGTTLPSAIWSFLESWDQLLVGDFNGDGKDDVAGFGRNGTWWTGLSSGDHQFATSLQPWAQWAPPSNWVQLFVADANGDLKDDVIGFDVTGRWWVGLSDGTGSFVTGPAWAQWSSPASWHQLFTGDFNGDGRTDVAGFGVNGTWFVGLFDGTGSFVTGPAWAQWSSPASWSQLFVGDMTGDGLDDIVGFGVTGAWFVGVSNGANTFATGSPWARWSVPSSWSELFLADVNGDGKKDLVGFGLNGTWWAGLSDGSGVFATSAVPWAQWSSPSSWEALFVGDFTSDGKADVMGIGFNSRRYVGVSDGVSAFTTGSEWTPIS